MINDLIIFMAKSLPMQQNFSCCKFFIRNRFIRNLYVEGQKVKELIPLTIKSLRHFSISNIVMTANNRELGSRFNSFKSTSHDLGVIHVARFP